MEEKTKQKEPVITIDGVELSEWVKAKKDRAAIIMINDSVDKETNRALSAVIGEPGRMTYMVHRALKGCEEFRRVVMAAQMGGLMESVLGDSFENMAKDIMEKVKAEKMKEE